jgi:hypothetical protein
MKIFGRLAILLGVMLLIWAAGIWFQDQEAGYEAGERAEAILDEAWGEAQVKLGIEGGASGQQPSLEGSASDASSGRLPDVAPTATARPDRVLKKQYAGILEIPSQKLTLCVYDKWVIRICEIPRAGSPGFPTERLQGSSSAATTIGGILAS